MTERSGLDIGRNGIGRKSFGRGVGRTEKPRKQINWGIRMKIERWRDKARGKLIQMRRRIKENVERNARNMEKRKIDRDKSLNPVVVSMMPSRNYAKLIRNPSNWSSVSLKPKYSGSLTTRERIYAKRFSKTD